MLNMRAYILSQNHGMHARARRVSAVLKKCVDRRRCALARVLRFTHRRRSSHQISRRITDVYHELKQARLPMLTISLVVENANERALYVCGSKQPAESF